VESKQAWDVGIGALVGAVLVGIMGRLTMGPEFGLYAGIALGAVVGVFLGTALSRR
jgi:outer membrane lipoprotein SlyB